MTTLPADTFASLSNEEILSQSLHVGRIISTLSSYAARHGIPQSGSTHIMTEIGRGFQGAVFEQPGRLHVLKKEHAGNSTLPTNIQHEYAIHGLVVTAFDRFGPGASCRVQVPRLSHFLEAAKLADEEFAGLPGGNCALENTAEMERILPMPKVVRKALVGYVQGSHDMLDAIPNKHCLLRTYLGRMPPKKDATSLRNYPLDLAMMESLDLNVHYIADSMGAAFAIMHWGAGVNGDDVEFVLGTRLQSQTAEFVQEREVGLFLLDFGQCDAVDLRDEPAIVYQAFKGAMMTGDNQLFIPNLVQRPDLYSSFKEGYVRTGENVLKQRHMDQVFNVEAFIAEYEEYAQDFL
ncbi:uncharacterized protein BBA_02040 [Beauveria bassiana ARSEF 2860]|uniref:DUF3669 domain-containing protein n=1 Tax=Beauveria bassiana (strain ARSEF 2860) TaxID=655819 RepID=J4WGF9_BEAB2|nr:uncharacterized protein BBA_02040 [Beauveria bassiana ARSEF 2860]EJP69005.1 hypothetical protein BBA_02040 [Beauveria bassiana ARSEF 2860]